MSRTRRSEMWSWSWFVWVKSVTVFSDQLIDIDVYVPILSSSSLLMLNDPNWEIFIIEVSSSWSDQLNTDILTAGIFRKTENVAVGTMQDNFLVWSAVLITVIRQDECNLASDNGKISFNDQNLENTNIESFCPPQEGGLGCPCFERNFKIKYHRQLDVKILSSWVHYPIIWN